ncbi:MAG: hypothetical protein IJ131_00050 [Eggerthellaceae bacterium]|nr:hypothetical protein [Eggerthellaceae bacterium]
MLINCQKKIARTLASTGLCLALAMGLCACNKAEEPAEPADPSEATQPADTVEPAEGATEEPASAPTDEFLAQIQGSFVPLFDVMGDEANKQVWYDQFRTQLGVEDEATAEMLRQTIISMFTAEAYGEDALKLVAEDPTYSLFHCGFTEGIATITIQGNTISGTDAAGNRVFSHDYVPVEAAKYDFGEEMNAAYSSYYTEEEWPTMYVYEAADATDGFKYFAFCGDTPAETFHIEFRYAPVREDIGAFYAGPCAYFMPSGFPADADGKMVEDVIGLFVQENAESFKAMADAAAAPAAA